MKKNRFAAGGAAVVFAAGMAIGAAAPATAAPAERIASAEQLHFHLAKAVELESATTGEISCCPAGQYAPEATGA
ncbi:hypothetical protein ACIQ9E_26745 [Streptomyces sp. NPDC094448]|uniref:hypothetical protein n=1 Tax=Streptomyces sp. NPDC094448 TaxID=3366063 RepID=UPI003802A7D3